MNYTILVISAGVALILVPLLPMFTMRRPWILLALLWVMPAVKLSLLYYVPAFRLPFLDPTVMVSVIIVLTILYAHFSGIRWGSAVDRPLLYMHIGLAILMAIGLLWTTAPNYGLNKCVRFGVLSTVALFGAMFLAADPNQLRRLTKAIIVIGILIALVMLISPGYMWLDPRARYEIRQTFLGGSPLNPAFAIAVACVLIVSTTGQMGKLFRTITILAVPLMLVAIFRTGSRAMFAQVGLGVAFWVMLTRTHMRWVYRILLAMVFCLFPLLLPLIARGAGTARVQQALRAPLTTLLTSQRVAFWEYVLSHSVERPVLGHGTGSFAMDYAGVDRNEFPHNFLLEALYEQGVMGFCLVATFLIIAFWRFFSWRAMAKRLGVDTSVCDAWGALCASAVSTAMFHWDLADSRLLWFCLGTLASQCLILRRMAEYQIYQLGYLPGASEAYTTDAATPAPSFQ